MKWVLAPFFKINLSTKTQINVFESRVGKIKLAFCRNECGQGILFVAEKIGDAQSGGSAIRGGRKEKIDFGTANDNSSD